jgi:hypothetical protein
VPLALLLGVLAGLAVDQLGPPQRVNLPAPAVWAVVLWNLVDYAALLLPAPQPGVLALDDDCFEALHPLMRPAGRWPLTLLWCPLAPLPAPVRLLGQPVGLPDKGGQRLLDGGDGDHLHRRALPPALREGPPPRPWWRRGWRPDPAADALAVLRREVDAVLVVLPPGPGAGARPGWLGALSPPLLLLSDADTAVAP